MVAGGEDQEDVAAAIVADTANPGEPYGGALGQAPALRGEQWGVGGNDNDNRAALRGFSPGGGGMVQTDLAANRHPIDPQKAPVAVIRLNQGAHHVGAALTVYPPGGCANTAFEVMADHPGSTTNAAFDNRAAAG